MQVLFKGTTGRERRGRGVFSADSWSWNGKALCSLWRDERMHLCAQNKLHRDGDRTPLQLEHFHGVARRQNY